MIGRYLGAFDMYVGYLTVRFAVTRPQGRPIAVWQDQHLVAELDPAEVDKTDPRPRFRNQTYATMTGEWRTHFTRWMIRIWRDHREAGVELAREAVTP